MTGALARRATGIRDGEGSTVGLIAAVFAAVGVGHGLGEVGVNTLVLSRIGADALPWLFIALGLGSMAIAVGYGAALGRVRRARLFTTILLVIAVVLAIEWAVLGAQPDVVAIAWLSVMAAGAIAVTIAWTVAGTTLDARQAKRLYPVCTAAAIAGSFTGNLAAGPVARILGTATLIAAEGVFLCIAALLIRRLAARSTMPGWRASGAVRVAGASILGDVRVGFDEVRHSPLMRLVAVAYVLFAVLLFSVSLPFLRAAQIAFPAETDLADALGLLSAGITALSFVVSLVVANRFYARFGVAAAALILPVVYLAGFGLWIVSFSFTTAAALTVAQQVTQRGLSNAAWSAFYNVAPAARRAQVLAFIDGVPGQLGIVLAGVLQLTAGRLLAPQQLFWLGLATALACTAVVAAIRRRYADALVRTLRSGVGERLLEGGPGLGDLLATPDVRSALGAAMRAPEPGTRQLAASLLARSAAPDARMALRSALDDDDALVRAAAIVSVLSGDAHGDARVRAEESLGALLAGTGRQRVAGLDSLRRLGRDPDAAVLGAAIADPDPAVRAAAIALVGATTGDPATSVLMGGLDDPASMVRWAAATALARRPSAHPRVISRLDDPSPDVQETALAALAGHGPEVHAPVLAWTERRIERALQLAGTRAALAAGPTPDAMLDFLRVVLAGRIDRQQRLALSGMAVLGASAADGVIRRSLRAGDPDVRAQAIEALDSMGDRHLARALTRLVEHPSDAPTTLGRDDVLRHLRDDDDPWIRDVARRIPLQGVDMADPDRSLGDIETMLRLRRVPLFAGLAPEDLQRIAMTATERTFEADAALIREGEVGDELFVILEGRVRVVRAGPDGVDHTLRTYEGGDHIGELAVLRERPRAATVLADGGAVRALVVDGQGLTAILRERPEAAMAMLATLAERISAQR